jgi:hypothetical protein
MKMYNDTGDGEKIVSYTVTNKSLDKNVKVFSSTKKEIAQHAFLNWYDIAVYDGEHENVSLEMIEAVTTKDRFRDAMKNGHAPIMLPNFDEFESHTTNHSDDQFIYIVYCDDRKTVWDVINGADIIW